MNTYFRGMPARGPQIQQWIGQVLAFNLNQVISRLEYVAIHEANLFDDEGSTTAPDVTVYRIVDMAPVVVFEVALPAQLQKVLKHYRQLLIECDGALLEVFVLIYSRGKNSLDYLIRQWHKLTPGYKASDEEAGFSTLLNLDLKLLAYEM
jgi:hypothetical protein